MTMEQRAIEILLVEDNPGDVRLTKEALRDGKIRNNLQVASDGQDALDLLKHTSSSGALMPDVVLLDLDLPGLSGREVLSRIKSDDRLRRIPVVILSSSEAEEDIVRSYDAHANCYLSKPLALGQFNRMVHAIEDFWFTIVKLPRSATSP